MCDTYKYSWLHNFVLKLLKLLFVIFYVLSFSHCKCKGEEKAITLEPGLADIYLHFTKCDLICFSRSQVKKFRLYFRKYPENCNTNANCI